MSFFGKIGSFFKHLFASAPTWSITASTALTLAGPLISKIVGLISGDADAAEAQKVIAEVQADLTAAKHLIADAHGTNNAKAIANVLGSVTEHLDELLNAGHIKNPDTLQKVKDIVGIVTATLQGIIAILPKSA